jgi:acyl-coenzyme A thioesterase PaaI-like protein
LTSEATRPARASIASATADRFELAPHNCFACGTLNTTGLGLRVHVEPGRSWAEFQLDRRFEGWEGMAHGGIIATILDEVMAWALVGADNWGVTARISVQFKAPVPLDVPLRAEGWTTRVRRRIVDTESRIVEAATGTDLATATGVYLAADAARKRELEARYGLRRLALTSDGSDR